MATLSACMLLNRCEPNTEQYADGTRGLATPFVIAFCSGKIETDVSDGKQHRGGFDNRSRFGADGQAEVFDSFQGNGR